MGQMKVCCILGFLEGVKGFKPVNWLSFSISNDDLPMEGTNFYFISSDSGSS